MDVLPIVEDYAGRLLQEDDPKPQGGPWGAGVDVFLCALPLIFLVFVTVVKPFILSTSVSLPVAAFMLWFIRVAYLNTVANYANAAVWGGFFEALTPLSIITGAILLFQAMHHTKCLPWMMGQIKLLSGGHPIAEIFLIGWAFAYMVEGASGFGTPVALAAPMLSSLGHDPLCSVVVLLVTNTLATQFGAVGTPIWFGFGVLGLTDENLTLVGIKAAIIVGACAYVIVPLVLMYLVPAKTIMKNILFIFLSISTATVPSVAISFFSYEFPSLLAGVISIFGTAVLIHFKVGLAALTEDDRREPKPSEDLYDVNDADVLASGASAHLKITDQGVVKVEPIPTLDFPLALDAKAYKEMRKRDCAVQVETSEVGHNSFLEKAGHTAGSIRQTRTYEKAAAVVATNTDDQVAGSKWSATDDTAPSADTYPPVTGAINGAINGMSTTGMSTNGMSTTNTTGTAPDVNGYQKKSVDLESGSKAGGDLATGDSYIVTKSNKEGSDHPAPVTKLSDTVSVAPRSQVTDYIFRTMPIWMTILILIITRVPQIGLKGILQSTSPSFFMDLQQFGKFGISSSAVIQYQSILLESINWKYEFFYVPFFLPFFAVSTLTVLMFFRDFDKGTPWYTPYKEAVDRVSGIVVATIGALCLVQLIRYGETPTSSPAYIIGYNLSSWLGKAFIAISAFLGALGSFFSGSTTVSNLTFGNIQLVAATNVGLSATTMLALQVTGATVGNMICINNILSAKAVMGLVHMGEGEFIKRTFPLAVLFCLLAEGIGCLFFFIPTAFFADKYPLIGDVYA